MPFTKLEVKGQKLSPTAFIYISIFKSSGGKHVVRGDLSFSKHLAIHDSKILTDAHRSVRIFLSKSSLKLSGSIERCHKEHLPTSAHALYARHVTDGMTSVLGTQGKATYSTWITGLADDGL